MANASSVPVLVIEDDEGNRKTICAMLEDEGYQVFAAPDGLSGLERLRTHPEPLVVLVDWKMPGMDGAKVLEAVAADTSLVRRHTYILMSASVDQRDFRSLTLPPDLTVTMFGKPFNLDDFYITVAAAAARLTNQPNDDDISQSGLI
jgi:CheY-like chemotaxis protein